MCGEEGEEDGRRTGGGREEDGRRTGGGRRSGYRTKIKKPTRQCGENHPIGLGFDNAPGE